MVGLSYPVLIYLQYLAVERDQSIDFTFYVSCLCIYCSRETGLHEVAELLGVLYITVCHLLGVFELYIPPIFLVLPKMPFDGKSQSTILTQYRRAIGIVKI